MLAGTFGAETAQSSTASRAIEEVALALRAGRESGTIARKRILRASDTLSHQLNTEALRIFGGNEPIFAARSNDGLTEVYFRSKGSKAFGLEVMVKRRVQANFDPYLESERALRTGTTYRQHGPKLFRNYIEYPRSSEGDHLMRQVFTILSDFGIADDVPESKLIGKSYLVRGANNEAHIIEIISVDEIINPNQTELIDAKVLESIAQQLIK